MADVRAVRAELDDLEALVPLFDAYRQFYAQRSDPQGARTFLAGRLKRGESVIFLAVTEGTVVGFTQLYPSFLIRLDAAAVDPERPVRHAGRPQRGRGACAPLNGRSGGRPRPARRDSPSRRR